MIDGICDTDLFAIANYYHQDQTAIYFCTPMKRWCNQPQAYNSTTDNCDMIFIKNVYAVHGMEATVSGLCQSKLSKWECFNEKIICPGKVIVFGVIAAGTNDPIVFIFLQLLTDPCDKPMHFPTSEVAD